MKSRIWLRTCGLLIGLLFAFVATAEQSKVRAITAFVQLERSQYERQIADTTASLRKAKTAFEQAGFEVQTLRITTQPFPTYIRGLSTPDAVALLDRLAQLAKQHGVLVNIGPAVLDDAPSPAALEILEQLHSQRKPLDSTMIVASDKGVHWNTVRAAARHVKRVAAASARSQGTFSFAATAMLAPGSPYYPGSYHLDGGGRFAVGLQSANMVRDVFGRTKGNPGRAASELAANARVSLDGRFVVRQLEDPAE